MTESKRVARNQQYLLLVGLVAFGWAWSGFVRFGWVGLVGFGWVWLVQLVGLGWIGLVVWVDWVWLGWSGWWINSTTRKAST